MNRWIYSTPLLPDANMMKVKFNLLCVKENRILGHTPSQASRRKKCTLLTTIRLSGGSEGRCNQSEPNTMCVLTKEGHQ